MKRSIETNFSGKDAVQIKNYDNSVEQAEEIQKIFENRLKNILDQKHGIKPKGITLKICKRSYPECNDVVVILEMKKSNCNEIRAISLLDENSIEVLVIELEYWLKKCGHL